MRRNIAFAFGLCVRVVVLLGAFWVLRPGDLDPERDEAPVQFTSRYDKPLPPPPSLDTPLSRMTAEEYTAGMTLEELRAKSKAREDADIHCDVQGVPEGSVGTLMHRGDQISAYVEEDGVARMSTTFYMKAGSGELSMAGYAPVQVSWTKDEEGFHCTPTAPSPPVAPTASTVNLSRRPALRCSTLWSTAAAIWSIPMSKASST
jgi:hypothetical protein